MKRSHRSILLSVAALALAVSGVLVAQDAVPSLQDLVGARGAAIDEIGKRGYTFIRTEKSGDSAYSYWRENENGQCVIEDYSRYGTFLNGHKIDGSAVLQVGDLVRLGTPGFELRLIMTEADDGA